ncbi:MAG: hypothetical protein ASARMPRED_008165 [Alectoria sarmentosa]|nr:MAG: hypothetical protein ASARMPRED_008165 [Alectoria sarmentosa]
MPVQITAAGPFTPQMLAKLPNDTLYPDILATIIVTFVLVTIFTALRLSTKWLTKSWNSQDLLLFVVWALNLAYNFTFLKWGKVGVGRHLWMITPSQSIEILKVGWVVSIMYGPMIWLAKAVLLLQIVSIFAPNKSQSKSVFWTAQVLIWGNFMLYTATFFVAIFQCRPVRKAWHSELDGYCINVNATYTFTGAANVVSDVLILLLPLWAIWHLRMAPKHKLGISAVCIISSICRLAYTIRLFNNKDRIYIFGKFALWTYVLTYADPKIILDD